MPDRKPLPARRRGETFKLKFPGQRGSFHVSCGYYDEPDNSVGEIFINSPKVGTSVEAIVKACAVLVSLALQHGVPLSVMAEALPKEEDGSQSTIIGAALEEMMRSGLERYPDRPTAPRRPALSAHNTDLVRNAVREAIESHGKEKTT